MKDVLRNIKRALEARALRRRVLRDARCAFRYDRERFERNAGVLCPDRAAAAAAEIAMGAHVLEKGLTMPHRRLPFGVKAALHLAGLVERFEARFGADDPQVRHAVGVLREWRAAHVGADLALPRLDAFLAARPGVPAAPQPHVERESFFAAKDAPFAAFAASRHVVRHFAGPAPRAKLDAALRLAPLAPSACNRQHARVRVVEDAETIRALFAVQGGTRGFGDDVRTLLVVTADLSCVRWGWERHDIWTNGGIFAMNLCYALHHAGLAHCILHWSVPPEADRSARALLALPEEEEIVLLVACGEPPEAFDVASSPRFDAVRRPDAARRAGPASPEGGGGR